MKVFRYAAQAFCLFLFGVLFELSLHTHIAANEIRGGLLDHCVVSFPRSASQVSPPRFDLLGGSKWGGILSGGPNPKCFPSIGNQSGWIASDRDVKYGDASQKVNIMPRALYFLVVGWWLSCSGSSSPLLLA